MNIPPNYNHFTPLTRGSGPDGPRGAEQAYPDFTLGHEVVGKIDLHRLLFTVQKYRVWVLSIASATVLIAAALTFIMTPIFRATSSIQIDRETVDVVNLKGVQAEQDPFADDFYQTKYELLSSRSVAERVAQALNLSEDRYFHAATPSIRSNIEKLLFEDKATDAVSADADQQRLTDVEALLNGVTIAPVRGSRIVRISFDHPNSAIAMKIANTYAQVFITDNLDRRYEATSYARSFLEDRLRQLKVKLEDSEKQLVRYAEKEGIINIGEDRNLALVDLESINAKLAEVHAARVKAELLWKRAQATDGFGLKEILSSPTIQDNRKQRASLSGQYQQKLAIFKPAFPDMVQLRNQIQELDRQAEAEIYSIKSAIESTYISAAQEEKSLQAQLAQTKIDVTT